MRLFILQDAVSIMEALTSLAVSLGPAFEPYAPAVFERTMQQLTAQQAALEAKVRGPFFSLDQGTGPHSKMGAKMVDGVL